MCLLFTSWIVDNCIIQCYCACSRPSAFMNEIFMLFLFSHFPSLYIVHEFYFSVLQPVLQEATVLSVWSLKWMVCYYCFLYESMWFRRPCIEWNAGKYHCLLFAHHFMVMINRVVEQLSSYWNRHKNRQFNLILMRCYMYIHTSILYTHYSDWGFSVCCRRRCKYDWANFLFFCMGNKMTPTIRSKSSPRNGIGIA